MQRTLVPLFIGICASGSFGCGAEAGDEAPYDDSVAEAGNAAGATESNEALLVAAQPGTPVENTDPIVTFTVEHTTFKIFEPQPGEVLVLSQTPTYRMHALA